MQFSVIPITTYVFTEKINPTVSYRLFYRLLFGVETKFSLTNKPDKS